MPERENKVNHKDMRSGENPPYDFEPGVVPMHGADLTRGGAIMLNDDGQPYLYVRGGFWRADKWDSVVRAKDVRPIAISERPPNFDETHVGSELELFAWNPEAQDLFPIMEAESGITEQLKNGNGNGFHRQANLVEEDPEHLNFSDELMRGQIELNFKHSTSSIEHAVSQLRAVKRVTRVSRENGVMIVPISTLPHRRLEPEDVNQDPYVQRIALEHMMWDRVQHFTGSSFQTHAEVSDSETVLRSVNYLQQLTPAVLAVSASSPFMNGKVMLNNDDITGNGHESKQWQSTRYPNRFIGSPSGGVIMAPAPETLDEFFELAHDDLHTNTSPTVARAFGHHVDFRFRPDIGDKGTVEAAVADSFGGHPKKIAAATEFFRAQAVKVQNILYEGRENDLPTQIFGTLDHPMLEQLHRDSYAVSMAGVEATISRPNGTETTAGDHFNEVLNWVNQPEPTANYHGMPAGVVEELRLSAMVVDEETFQKFKPGANTFLSGFYETGIGTLSQWLHRRAQQMIEVEKLSEEEATKQCTTELGAAYHAYVHKEGLEQELEKMFE